MLRLSRSNPRKKYEIDIKCDCEDPEKSGECMNDMTLRRPVNSKPPNASKLNPPNDPHPRTPNVKSTANCGDFPRGEFPEDVLKKDGSASLIAGNTMGSPEMARFVGLVRLCEASAHFSNRISCCISLPGPAESFCPSQGCALTQWPRSQRRTQLGRRKSAPRQRSPMQSN